uniref:Uncharacterized protein n=1 Tax=Pithovirus LCPAC304 TaxID=2506594 RepID=A0A481Z907_9VIRU|nr:MAG: hypothetical protein LCPAC304_02010 [Pithovirus LCPAC304]
MLSSKSKLSKAEMGRYAKEQGLRVSKEVKDRLYKVDKRDLREKEYAFMIAANITKSVGRITIIDFYVTVAFDLIDACKKIENTETSLTKTAIRETIAKIKVKRKDGTVVNTRSSPDTVDLLFKKDTAGDRMDASEALVIIDLAARVMIQDGKSTLKFKYVQPIYNGLVTCLDS